MTSQTISDQFHGGEEVLADAQGQDPITKTRPPILHPVGCLFQAQRQGRQSIQGQPIRLPQRIVARTETSDQQRSKVEAAHVRIPRVAGLLGTVESREGAPGPDPPRFP